MADEEAQEAKAKCGSCGLEYSQEERRLHGRNFKCGNCKNVEQTLRRHLGTTAELQEFSQEESEKFFKATHAAKCPDGKLAWQTIRATLLKRMTEVRIASFESKVAVEELPLSVLLTRGWEEQVVRKFPSEFSEAHGCDLFKVPVRTCTWAEAFQSSEETLLEREKQASKKKGSKDMDVPLAGPSGKEEAESKKADRKKAQEAKKVVTENVKIATWAAKCLGPLTQAETSLTKVIAKGDTVPDPDEKALTLCKDNLVTVTGWIKASKEAVSLQDHNKEKEEEAQVALVSLPCDATDVKVLLKQIAEATKALRGSFPKPKAKAKAVAGAEASAPKRRRTKQNP